jgi:hypothetical protein
MSQLSITLSAPTMVQVSNFINTTTETVFPDESFTTPCDSSYEEMNCPPSVNHFRNRVMSNSFYDKNGNIPSVFLLPSLEETPTRTTDCTMHLNLRLKNRIHLQTNVTSLSKDTMEIKRSDLSIRNFKSINFKNLRMSDSHKIRKMTRRLSNSAHAA